LPSGSRSESGLLVDELLLFGRRARLRPNLSFLVCSIWSRIPAWRPSPCRLACLQPAAAPDLPDPLGQLKIKAAVDAGRLGQSGGSRAECATLETERTSAARRSLSPSADRSVHQSAARSVAQARPVSLCLCLTDSGRGLELK
jgi:hypothetical protein